MIGPLYQMLAHCVLARQNCIEHKNDLWIPKHTESIRDLVHKHMPSGSGWDMGTTLDLSGSKPDRLVFNGSYHHMDSNGFYDGWTDHAVIVTPSLVHDINIRITGRNRNDVKEYLHQWFHEALTKTVTL